MDYSYFSAPAQSYPYMGLPPTPAHSYEPHDEHTNDGPDAYHDTNAFHTFEQNFRFDPQAFVAQQQHSPPQSQHRPSLAHTIPSDNPNGVSIAGDYENNETGNGRSSSEEKESLTPAQSRRKAQNRAAQRAFRERKERHVKDLETKLNSLEAHSSTLLTDNERLKRELQKLATQNEILRATSSHSNQHVSNLRAPSPLSGPLRYTPKDFQAAVGIDHPTNGVSHRIHRSAATGERLLAAGATWDMIQSHELYQRGMIDVSDVCERLKGNATCDGTGPAFSEGAIKRAIEESVASCGDQLI